jgi:transcriptional regulator with XRE-family HTH domain
MEQFGEILKDLRTRTGLGIKRLAPELGVSYSYLSKLEHHEVAPSEELVGRVAKYFEYNYDRLLISAGKVPEPILRILQENPEEALGFLRERFGSGRQRRSRS